MMTEGTSFDCPEPNWTHFGTKKRAATKNLRHADGNNVPVFRYLFINEAGQVRLLGDPLQLAQVSQAVHPNHSGDSVLEHLLGEHATIPPDRGLFLEHTRRMHPDVCRFVSEVVYEGRLQSMVTGSPPIPTGLRFIAVDHEGKSQSSIEEATRVADEIAKLSVRAGFSRPSFLVVAPYNAQVRCVTEVLAQRGITNVPVGTVDKFHGRETDVVFFTMATSSGADLPRDIDFLFSKNRLNVAISRALPGDRRRQPAPAGRRVQHAGADDARQCAV